MKSTLKIFPLFSRLKFIFFILIFYCKAQGQEGFKNYSINQGLPSSQNFDIIQDDQGYIWFATDNGLSRYNGYEFENFDTQDGLTDNTVFNFHKRKNGNIWCTSFNKRLFFIVPDKKKFIPYSFNKIIDSLKFQEVFVLTCFYQAPDESVFLSFLNSVGFLRISKSGKLIHNSVARPIRNENIRTSMYVDQLGQSFFFQNYYSKDTVVINGFHNTILCSIGKNNPSDFFKATFLKNSKLGVFATSDSIVIMSQKKMKKVIQSSIQPISVGEYDANHFWVGFRYGGYKVYDLDGNETESNLEGYSVNKVYFDHEGGIWISTLDAGVFHKNNSSVKTIVTESKEDAWINDLIVDKSGKLWASYYNGNIYTDQELHFKKIYSSIHDKSAHLAMNEEGQVWLCSDEYLINSQSGEKIFINQLPVNFSFIEDSVALAGYLSVSFYKTGKLVSSVPTNKRVNDICLSNDQIYIACNDGLFLLSGKSLKREKSFPKNMRITDLESWNKKLLVGTRGDGVYVLKGRQKVHITRKQGLNSNIVTCIKSENENTFWVCTNAGINRVQLKKNKYEISSISVRNGLISNEVTAIEFKGDTVWVGTKNGLCYFSKKALLGEQKKKNYFLKISRTIVNDGSFSITNNAKLSHDENRVQFDFDALSYRDDQTLLYRYKLEGLENNWNYTRSRYAIYSSLPPGSYHFVLQVKGENKKWDEQEAGLTFEIFPPYWQTTWFRLSAFATLLLVIYLFFRYNILSYNRDIVRELLRQLLKRLTHKKKYLVFREQGKDVRIETANINFVKSDGNYLEIHTDQKKYVVRYKIGEFLKLVPDPLEFLRINRSYIIRLDKVESKNRKEVIIKGEKIPVGETYQDQVDKIQF